MAKGVDLPQQPFGLCRFCGQVGVQGVFMAQLDDVEGLHLSPVTAGHLAGQAQGLFADLIAH